MKEKEEVLKRLFEVNEIPESLWDSSNKILRLPRFIISSWESILEERGLLELARDHKKREEGNVGGVDENATNKHYCFNFNGSCARFQLSFLDPKQELPILSNAFVKSLAGDDVFIVDIPSGTGAASLSLLCNIAQLREENILPTIDLSVEIMAGDVSESAIQIFEKSFSIIEEYLNDYKINVKLHTEIWDVNDSNSTNIFVKNVLKRGRGFSEKLLIIANFTGYLEKEGKWNEVKSQFQMLFTKLSEQSTMAVWLEPKYKISTVKFFPKLKEWFKKWFKTIFRKTEDIIVEKSDAKFHHGLRDSIPRTNVAVVKFKLEEL